MSVKCQLCAVGSHVYLSLTTAMIYFPCPNTTTTFHITTTFWILLRRFAAGPFCNHGAALIEVVLAVRAVGQIVSPLMVVDRG
jgi:hypothetical protein